MNFRAAKALKKRFVELLYFRVGRLFGTTAEMHRSMDLPAFGLAFVEKAQARNEERDQGRWAVHFRPEGFHGARLVMVFEKARGAVLEEGLGHEVFADLLRCAGAKAIV